MRVTPSNERITVRPGSRETFALRLQSDTDSDWQYELRISEPELPVGWFELSLPGHLARGEVESGELALAVPENTRLQPGTYHATVACTEITSGAATTVNLEIELEEPCRILSEPPTIVIEDGRITAEVALFNCLGIEMPASLSFDHEDGWSFELDDPRLTLEAGKGSITAEVELRPPKGREVRPGDEITLQVATAGTVASASSAVKSRGLSPGLPPRSLARIVATTLLGLVIFIVGVTVGRETARTVTVTELGPTVTITESGPTVTITEPGPTVTVTEPAPTVTVTVTATPIIVQ